MTEGNSVIPIAGKGILGRGPGPSRDPVVKLYDFRRPDKFSREQIRSLEIIHGNFAGLAENRLMAELRAECEIRLSLVDQLTFAESLQDISAPTVLCSVVAKPLQ